MNNKIVINTDGARQPEAGNDLYKSRKNALMGVQKNSITATVVVLAYNRLEKTKECVESVLRYTTDVSYKLILVDNGSSDGTLEYFENIEYSDKLIIHITNNIGGAFAMRNSIQNFEGRFLVFLANDLIVTTNWLSNLIKCAMSDERIGLVQPVSSNVSNNQQVDLDYSNREQMQEEAKRYNISDPKKWHERMRIITLGSLITRECLSTVGPFFDIGFFHDFGDDDLAFRIRRVGYKVVLARDVWVHHNHQSSNFEDKNKEIFIENLQKGRQNFSDKYYGIDAWNDVSNFEKSMISMIMPPENTEPIHVLGIDVRCGTPILEIKNRLKEFNVFNTVLSAFTQDAKYYIDLKTICEGAVVCDREEYLYHHFEAKHFDYVFLGNPINQYKDPLRVLESIMSLCKDNAQILCKFRNYFDYKTFLNILGQKDVYDIEYGVHISIEAVNKWLISKGYKINNLTAESELTSTTDITYLKELISKLISSQNVEPIFNSMAAKDCIISITKNLL